MEHRVQKIISNAGYCSRRNAEELIEEGKVKVNDVLITIGDKADPEKDKITVEGKLITQPSKIYLALNKPKAVLTTLDDPRDRPTILNYIPKRERLIPVGRLDYNTEGLLLLTNDGDFANKVMHPRYEVNKTYIVTVDRPFEKKDAELLRQGIIIEEKETYPAKIKFVDNKNDTIQVTIHEGRNRIVRKMMKELDYHVERLVRIKVGDVELGNLESGKFRDLTKKEIESFLNKTTSEQK